MGNLTIRLGWNHQLDDECNACHKHVEGDWVVLSISDTGSGIQQDVVDRIFEPFYTTKAVGQGTGMGLSVLSAIVEGHGGHILVDTKIGAGTTFKLLFPPAQAMKMNRVDAIAQTGEIVNHGNGEKIFIVDDEPFLTDFLSEILSSYGYECEACNQSTDALARVAENPRHFDLLITDQTMPQLLGTDMIQKIWAINPDIPVILTTGYSDFISREQAENLGMSYMNKPVDIAQLRTTISRLLSKPK